MRKESWQWADGVVSTFARSERTDISFCSAIREWELWDGKGVRKKLGKNGRQARGDDNGVAGRDKRKKEMATDLIRKKNTITVGKKGARIPWWVETS